MPRSLNHDAMSGQAQPLLTYAKQRSIVIQQRSSSVKTAQSPPLFPVSSANVPTELRVDASYSELGKPDLARKQCAMVYCVLATYTSIISRRHHNTFSVYNNTFVDF